jgi:hypothetical protein
VIPPLWEKLVAHMRTSEPETEIKLARRGQVWHASYESPYQAVRVATDDPGPALEELARKVLL